MKYVLFASLAFISAMITMARIRPLNNNHRGEGKKEQAYPFIAKDAGDCFLCEGEVQEACYCPEVQKCHSMGCPLPPECVEICTK